MLLLLLLLLILLSSSSSILPPLPLLVDGPDAVWLVVEFTTTPLGVGESVGGGAVVVAVALLLLVVVKSLLPVLPGVDVTAVAAVDFILLYYYR